MSNRNPDDFASPEIKAAIAEVDAAQQSKGRTYLQPSATDDAQALIFDLTALEMRANALGLFPAARALNNAKNAIGWQLAGDIAAADAASTRREGAIAGRQEGE